MNIHTALNKILEEYPRAKSQAFSNHSLANYIRQDVPNFIENIIGPSDRYFSKGSAGQGNWASIPWVAIFDRLITETAQDGYDIVYLIKEDYSGVYISLNQGVTTIRKVYGSDAKDALRARAGDFFARLGEISKDCISGKIDLAVSNQSGLGSYYEYGNVVAKYYSKDSIPDKELLEQDLLLFLSFYRSLATKDLLPSANTSPEDDEKDLNTEDLTILKEHKRIERNRKLSEKAKAIHGYSCQACGFDFEKKYGALQYCVQTAIE